MAKRIDDIGDIVKGTVIGVKDHHNRRSRYSVCYQTSPDYSFISQKGEDVLEVSAAPSGLTLSFSHVRSVIFQSSCSRTYSPSDEGFDPRKSALETAGIWKTRSSSTL